MYNLHPYIKRTRGNTLTYYRAKKDAYDWKTEFNLIKNELLTEKEKNIFCKNFSDNLFEKVQVKKTNTYFSFGCRFEDGKEYDK